MVTGEAQREELCATHCQMNKLDLTCWFFEFKVPIYSSDSAWHRDPSRVKTSVLNSVQQKNASIADYRQLVRLLRTAEESVAGNYFPKTEAKLFAVSRVKCLGV